MKFGERLSMMRPTLELVEDRTDRARKRRVTDRGRNWFSETERERERETERAYCAQYDDKKTGHQTARQLRSPTDRQLRSY